MLCNDFMSVIWGMNLIWQGWITPPTTAWLPTTPPTYSTVTLDTGTKSLNHAQHQWCSFWHMRTQVMVFSSAVAIVVQGWWYIDGYDIQQFYKYYMKHIPRLSGVDHPVYYNMTSNYTNDILSWYPGYWKNQDLEPWHLISGIVIQGWWRTYRYGIPLFYECYMKHELYLTGLDHPLDHHMTSNYTKDMLSCYPRY